MGSGQPEVGVYQGFAPDLCFTEHPAGEWPALYICTAWGAYEKTPSWLVQDTRVGTDSRQVWREGGEWRVKQRRSWVSIYVSSFLLPGHASSWWKGSASGSGTGRRLCKGERAQHAGQSWPCSFRETDGWQDTVAPRLGSLGRIRQAGTSQG